MKEILRVVGIIEIIIGIFTKNSWFILIGVGMLVNAYYIKEK